MGKVVSISRDVTAVNRHEIDAPAGVLYSYNGLEQRGRVQRFDDPACCRRSNQHMCHVFSSFRSRVPPSPGTCSEPQSSALGIAITAATGIAIIGVVPTIM